MTSSYGNTCANGAALCFIASLALPLVALAQALPAEPTEEAPTTREGEAVTSQPEDAVDAQAAAPARGEPEPAGEADVPEEHYVRLELEQQQEEIAALRQEVEQLKLTAGSSMEGEDYSAALAGQDFEPSFKVYGFFDLNLFYMDVDERDAAFGVIPDHLSFAVNRLNLYFASQMSETLAALAEIRFTALPLGYEESFHEELFFNTPYQRVDTRVVDPFTSEGVRLGSIAVERVHLTWKPIDAFGVTAGRFLTPYGIWNVDHGSPVRLPVMPPYFMVRELIPSAQTGVQLFGRVFPFASAYLDYAVTLSNNRGSTDSVYDMENNKALGFRLKGTYESTDFTAALGGYLYYGTVRDVIKRISSYIPVFRIQIDETEQYTELVGSLDLLLKLYGARLQVEYLQGAIQYSKRPLRVLPVLEQPTPLQEYQPDYEEWALYALLGYDFFFDPGTTEMVLTPYGAFEYIVTDDTYPDLTEWMLRFGLNFRPSPFVVLKLEATDSVFPDSNLLEHGIWSYSAQMAVSF